MSELIAEGLAATGGDRATVAVDEGVAGEEDHTPAGLEGTVSEGVEEVGLTEAGPSVEDQRVVLALAVGETQGGAIGEAVGLDDREGIEGEAAV